MRGRRHWHNRFVLTSKSIFMQATREQVQALFERNTIADVIPSREVFEERLLSGKPFHIYLGIDPTAKQVQLGHIQNILLLEDLRRMGAKVTLLFGSFTGLIGDPTGKEKARSQLTRSQVREHMRSWKQQVSPVLNLSLLSNARINYNHRWFDKVSLEQFLGLLRETTAQQLLERDMFQKRLDSGKPLYAHEMMYPILQGYDSVAMGVDAELCGTDQTFNALMGRTMTRRYLDKEKFVLTMALIQADGVMMSKSAGTGVFVDVERGGNHRMFGAIMALPDGFIDPLFRGCTRIAMDAIAEMDFAGGVATRDAKLRLAREIVGMFWGVAAAKVAEADYITQFREKAVPDTAPTITVDDGAVLLDVVVAHTGMSRSEAKRKFAEGAVSFAGEKVTAIAFTVAKDGAEQVLRVGRKVFRVR